jgi:tRNA pseudouridine38-40 synthase
MLEAHCVRDEVHKELIFCDFIANAFLTGQVRRMVGTLLLVGQKRLSLQEFVEIVQRAEKVHPGSAAPPHGLCLVQVRYPEIFGVNE